MIEQWRIRADKRRKDSRYNEQKQDNAKPQTWIAHELVQEAHNPTCSFYRRLRLYGLRFLKVGWCCHIYLLKLHLSSRTIFQDVCVDQELRREYQPVNWSPYRQMPRVR